MPVHELQCWDWRVARATCHTSHCACTCESTHPQAQDAISLTQMQRVIAFLAHDHQASGYVLWEYSKPPRAPLKEKYQPVAHARDLRWRALMPRKDLVALVLLQYQSGTSHFQISRFARDYVSRLLRSVPLSGQP